MKKYFYIPFLYLLVLCLTADASLVRVIYFTPNNRPARQAIRTSLDTQIKAVQNLYANQMYAHGYGNKTFQIETDREGKLVVHHFTGNHNDAYYHTDTLRKVHSEVNAHFDTDTDVYAVFVDVSTERIQGNCGIAYYEGGPAMFPVTGDCIEGDSGISLIAHELGHAFNLVHDFRSDAYIMSYGYQRTRLSGCAARLLNVSRHFNNTADTMNTSATIEMLTPSTYPADANNWEIRFRIEDTDGIYQVQFEHAAAEDAPGLADCQKFDNAQSETVAFSLPIDATAAETNKIWIRVVDQNGYVDVMEWTLRATGAGTPENLTYLTLSYDNSDALTPTNTRSQWDGWLGHLWEKTPDGKISQQPPHYLTHPYVNTWGYWFYAHAESRIVYDISGKDYTKFESLFYLPHPCDFHTPTASMEVICFADSVEIYNSGILRGTAVKEDNRHQISFDIPAGSQELTIRVTDGQDGATCDHFVVGNPRLLYNTEPITITPDENHTDVNNDRVVNLVDLVMVASRYGERITGDPTPNPDVNRDGIVDINDLILITNEMPIGSTPSAPSALIQTALLPNYPNPFNPETWIPYRLAKGSDVQLRIYNTQGRMVRHLNIGHQAAGVYQTRSRAVYWDGQNEMGESVASGLYFYTLTAGDFSATRRMLILK